MPDQLIPPPELAPPVPQQLTPQQWITLWMDAYDAGEQLLLAGLARQVGPEGDVIGAYRRWNDEYLAQHDRMMFRMMERLDSLERAHVR